MADKAVNVRICMGSSCFARGNSDTLACIRSHFQAAQDQGLIRLEGSLCENNCHQGPNIVINGRPYGSITAAAAVELIENELKNQSRG
jgi:NADH:ubiquinone oxidoreductase subunit E